jgi:predicted peroxiredoxin
MKLLVHSATGPENPTRAALALLVARTAAEEGHDVRLLLAGDAVHLARERQPVFSGCSACSGLKNTRSATTPVTV